MDGANAPDRLAIGCMTGTSVDALDAALLRIEGAGLAMRAHVERCATLDLGDLGPPLRELAQGGAMPARAIARLALDLGRLHAQAVEQLLDGGDDTAPALVAIHGQTVFHAPPASWQVVNPWPIARAAGCPVVHDLRAADLASGGQGAPITPLADWILFRDAGHGRTAPRPTAVVNLGGFCNITLLPARGSPADVRGMDVCACNQILDAAARRALGARFDEDGAAARRGRPDDGAERTLVEALGAQSRSHRSLGSGDEVGAWVERWATRLKPEDLLATAAGAIGRTIAAAAQVGRGDLHPRVVLAGGGVRNAALVGAIERSLGRRTETADAFGVPATHREAAAMAVLGALCMDGEPITLPAVTGVAAPAPLAGAWVNTTPAPTDPQSRRPQPARPRSRQDEGQQSLRGAPPEGGGSGRNAVRAAEPADHAFPPDRSHIATERRNPRTMALDVCSVEECVALLNRENDDVPRAVAAAAPALCAFIRDAERCLLNDGRLVYIGAGTSGRLGVLDASECPPTFQTPPEMVVGVIAGGDAALRRSSEGREDDRDDARAELERIGIGPRDAILGIAAGGTTPYVLGALEHAEVLGATTGLLTCASIDRPPGVRHLIVIDTGPEPLTGSTRMKAGTATKIALNTISTTLMVRLGKVYENLMVDLRATNAKLRDRAARIVSMLTGLERAEAFALLDRAGGAAKTAIVMHRASLDRHDAESRLDRAGGVLRRALEGGHP